MSTKVCVITNFICSLIMLAVALIGRKSVDGEWMDMTAVDVMVCLILSAVFNTHATVFRVLGKLEEKE